MILFNKNNSTDNYNNKRTISIDIIIIIVMSDMKNRMESEKSLISCKE